jgi:curved DNA-binding protein CbpA
VDGSSGDMRVDFDHYLILGVPRTADPAVIRAAYVALAKRYHPDVAIGDAELAAANFRLIKEAYETLSDPERRTIYDQKAQQAETMLARVVIPVETGPPTRLRTGLEHFAALFHGGRRTGLAVVAGAIVLVSGFLATRYVLSTYFADQPASIASQVDDEETKRREQERLAIAQGRQASQSTHPRQAMLGPMAKPGTTAQQGTRLELPAGQVQCVAADGVRFSIVNRNGEVSVVYNGDPVVQASIQHAGKHFMLLTGIVPDDSIIISVLRGEGAGALVFHADSGGKLTRTVPARCVGLAY